MSKKPPMATRTLRIAKMIRLMRSTRPQKAVQNAMGYTSCVSVAARLSGKSEDAHAPAESLFVEFGDGHDAQFPKGDDDEAGEAHDEGDHACDEADVEGGESAGKALLRGVHDGDQPQFAADHGGHGQVGFERPPGDDVIAHVPDVPVGVEADDDGADEIEADDCPVDCAEIGRYGTQGIGGHRDTRRFDMMYMVQRGLGERA